MKKNTFTEGKILSPLLNFAVPVLFAMFLQAMYGAADLLIVGRFGTASGVSGVATGSHILQTITSIIIGLSMGTTILIGQRIGEKRQNEVGKIIGSGICIFAVFAVIMTVLMVLFTNTICRVMQTPEEAFYSTENYVRICSIGSIFIVAYNVLGSIFRGIGDSKTPLIAVFIACIINIFGDLLLVGRFGMGASGAAIATVFAQAISVILSCIIISKRGLPFPFYKSDIHFNKAIIKKTITLGAPIALQDGLVSISFLAITAIVNSLGVVSSAGVGVAEKLCMFIMLVPSAFMQSMSAFVAQNIGAMKYKRARLAMLYGMITSFSFGIVMFYVSFFHGDMLGQIFSTESDVVNASWQFMKSYAIDCLMTPFLFCFIGYFNGCGKTTFVMVQGIIGAFLIRIPISFFMSKLASVSLFLVGMATPCSTVVQIILCSLFLIRVTKEQKIISTNIS